MNLNLEEIQQEVIKLQGQLVVLEELEDMFYTGMEGGDDPVLDIRIRSLESIMAGVAFDIWNRRCNLKEVYHGASR